MRTEPLNQSDGPIAEGCKPDLLISIVATPFLRLSFGNRSVQLLNGLAAVDDHRAADDKACGIRTQPEDRIGNLFGASHPSDWLLRDHSRPPLRSPAGEATHHRSIDIAGANGVDANVLRRVVEGRGPGEADHAVLRRSVGWAAFDSDDPGT